MPACRACHHPQRDQIDHEIVRGKPLRVISAGTGLSLGGLSRHRAHIANLLGERSADERAVHASDLVQRAEGLLHEANEILSTAKSEKNFAAAVGAVNACSRLIELLMRAGGELQNTPGGIHFTQVRITTNYTPAAIDEEMAQLIAEATNNFSADRIEELKRIACKSCATQPLTD